MAQKFMVAGRTIKYKTVDFYYYITKILSCFDSIKFRFRELSL